MANQAPRTDPRQRRGGRWRAVLPLGLLMLLGIGLLVSGVFDRFDTLDLTDGQAVLRATIDHHAWLARLGYGALLAIAVATGVPGTIVIVLAGGLFFGTIESTALSSVAVVIGSLVLYAASRRAFGPGGREPPEFARRLRERYDREPVRYTFALRFVPVVPLGAMTIALAWLRCPAWLFTLATWCGVTLSVAIESAIGAGVADTLDKGAVLGPGALLNARLLVPLLAFAVLALLPLATRAVRSLKHSGD